MLLTLPKRVHRSTLAWVEPWQKDEELEAVCLSTQEFGHKGEQKNRAGTDTVYGYVKKKKKKNPLERWEILENVYVLIEMIK